MMNEHVSSSLRVLKASVVSIMRMASNMHSNCARADWRRCYKEKSVSLQLHSSCFSVCVLIVGVVSMIRIRLNSMIQHVH